MRKGNTETGGGGNVQVAALPHELSIAPDVLEQLFTRAVQGRHAGFYERIAKPLVDRVVAAALCILVAPMLVLISVAIAVNLGAPVLLRQKRVGLHGRPFSMLKFRTMRPDRRREVRREWSGQDRRRTHKSPNDPRHVPLGRFLRRWSLDELPQLLNVVRGDMSLVGPRPELLTIVERYAPWQHLRHQVKPGITGLWQTTARGDAPMHELTEVDLAYVERVSFATDVRILLLTVPVVLGLRRGF